MKCKENLILRLKKALYGIKQAPRGWYHELHDYFISLGFTRSKHEQAVYLKKLSTTHLIIRVYMDDLTIIWDCEGEICDFKNHMEFFEMNDLGLLSSYLGIEVRQGRCQITLSHSAYVLKILGLVRMTNYNSIYVPLKDRPKFDLQESSTSIDSTHFQSLIGSLKYLSHTS